MMNLPRIFKKKKFLFFLLISLFFLLVPAAKAMVVDGGGGGDGQPTNYQLNIWEPAVYQTTEMNQQSFANETIRATIASFNDKILGCVNCPEEYQEQGAIQSVGNLIAGIYLNPPASSVDYFADLGRNLGIAKPAYAQGIGFEGLKPILFIWKAFRNIAYLFFVVIFVIVGFAIMFRLKIDPQTVISIQNALPRIIMALILVTFSYAIAGLIIDLIYVIISLFFALLDEFLTSDFRLQETLGKSIFISAWEILGGFKAVTAPGEAIHNVIGELFKSVPGMSAIFGLTGGALATLVFAIAIGFALFKLFFQLLISYVSIILAVIFAPLMLLLEAIPGQKGFGAWLRMLLANVIPFPLVAGILMLANAFRTTFLVAASEGKAWVAPFLGTVGVSTANFLPALVSLGMILLAPSIVDSVKKAIGAPGIGAGIGAPIGAAAGVVFAPITYPAGVIRAGVEREMGTRMGTRIPSVSGIWGSIRRGRMPPGEQAPSGSAGPSV